MQPGPVPQEPSEILKNVQLRVESQFTALTITEIYVLTNTKTSMTVAAV